MSVFNAIAMQQEKALASEIKPLVETYKPELIKSVGMREFYQALLDLGA